MAIGCEGDTLQRAKKQGNLRFDAAFFAFRLILSVEACKSLLGNLLIKDRPLSSKNLCNYFDTLSNANGHHGHWIPCKFHSCIKFQDVLESLKSEKPQKLQIIDFVLFIP